MTLKKVPITKGKIHFKVEAAGKECFTWYKVFGDLSSGVRPLIALHGGPGIGHDYILSLADLATKYGIPVIFYDQIGCGNSTHLREKNGDKSFWIPQLFIDEFYNLVEYFGLTTYDIYGNSWGAMLGVEIAITQPKGLNKLIVGDAPASIPDWLKAVIFLKNQLPKAIRDVIDECEKNQDFDNPEYEEACMYYYKLHVCRLDPWPQELLDAFEKLGDDKTVYVTMYGPSELTVTGSLKSWDVKAKLGSIKNEVLLLNGRYDEARDKVMEPYWNGLGGKIRWYTFAKSSHMPFWEERDHFMKFVAAFLKG